MPRSDVAIDVKPGNPDNVVNPHSRGYLQVAILGSASFDVHSVDLETLRFGPREAPARRGSKFRDVDADGDVDLVARSRLRAVGLMHGVESFCLSWQTWDATAYQGCDAIRTLAKHGKKSSKKGSGPRSH